MSNFWSTWIVILTLGNIAFMVWLLYATSRGRPGDGAKSNETTGHAWDGDLTEYNNPLPRWWLWMFYLSIAFGLGYLVIYPGLGSYRGTAGWTGASQWSSEVAQAQRAAAPIYARYQTLDIPALQHDAEATATARHLFANNCAQCHGGDGHGAVGFPNLAAANWQWGREPDAVVETITNGRQALMPAWRDVLDAKSIAAVSEYVYSLSGRPASPAALATGKEVFATYCAACHGPDGKGQSAVGAPNLADENWLYGGSLATITQTVTGGRAGQMPAHGARLSDVQIKVLAAYVLGLTDAGRAPGN